MRKKRFWVQFFSCAILLFILCYAHLKTGFTEFSNFDLLRIIFGGGNSYENLTVFDFRLLRLILAMLIVVGLSMAGAVFQTVLHNELASPGLLGVNAGAGLAVMLLVFLVDSSEALPFWAMPTVAIAGAMLVAGFIYSLAYKSGRKLATHTLILTGISLTAGIHALQIMLVVRLEPQQFHVVNTWIIGSIAGSTWTHAATLLPIILLLGLYLWAKKWSLIS